MSFLAFHFNAMDGLQPIRISYTCYEIKIG